MTERLRNRTSNPYSYTDIINLRPSPSPAIFLDPVIELKGNSRAVKNATTPEPCPRKKSLVEDRVSVRKSSIHLVPLVGERVG